MSAATAAIDTPERPGVCTRYPVAAATTLYAGTLAALNSSGNLVNAADTAGLRVVGRVEADVDNSAGSAGDLYAVVKRGVFRFANSGSDAVDADDKGKLCFVADNQTVNEAGGTNKVIAGRVIDVDTDGVWVEVGHASLLVPIQVTLTSTNGTMAAAADDAATKAEGEKIGDDVRAIHAALVSLGLLLP